jgi:hypothetical protein
MRLREFIERRVRAYLKEEEILNEGASDILYHFTYTDNLLNILKTNEFSLTSVVGSKSDYNLNQNKFFYLSTTRSKSSGYIKGDVKIVLDGRKLKYNNKIVPVDYWQWSKNRNDWDSDSSYINALKSEQEDRIISDKPTIPNAIKNIIEIHIYINKVSNVLKEIIEICKNNNIKVYLYDNKENWLNQTKAINNIDFSNIIDDNYSEDDSYKERDYFDYDIASLLVYNDIDNYNKITKHLNDADKIKKLDNILKERTYNNFRVGAFYFDDGINYLNSSLDNIRSKSNKESKYLIFLLIKDFKKYGVNNIKDYLLKKQFKGKKTLNDYKKELRSYLVTLMLNEYPDGLDRYFERYIEIDGKYYNHGYESEEIIKVLYEYINKIKEYLDDKIFNTDIFKYNYVLDKDYIKKYIDFDNIKLSDKINITDSYYDIKNIDSDFKDLIEYYLIMPIYNEYYDKIKTLNAEYESQFV